MTEVARPGVDTVWISRKRGRPWAKVRLFCLAHAGGDARAFHSWSDLVPPAVEVCAVQLPGRGDRFDEQPFTRLRPLVLAMAEALAPSIDRPFAVFGHSMGALLGFELVRHLYFDWQTTPLALFVASHRAPHLPPTMPPIFDLPAPAFVERLRRYQGTPDEVLNNRELLEVLMPTLRADFAVCDTYQFQAGALLPFPIRACGGRSDRTMRLADLIAWRTYTSASFDMALFPGGHFFLHDSRAPLVAAVSGELSGLLAAAF